MSSMIRQSHFPTRRLLQENVKLLRHLRGTKNLEMGEVIYSHSPVSDQCSGDNMLKSNAVIALHSEFAARWSGYRAFNQTNNQNIVVSWSALISENFQNGSAFEVLRLFKSMVSDHDESCPPDNYISSLVLTSCIKVKYKSLGRQCHGYMLKSGLVFHHYVKTALLHFYCMLSDMVGAVEALVSVHNADNCPHFMIEIGPGEKDYLEEAFVILRRKLAEDMVWNKATYVGLFGLCARLRDKYLGRQVHNKLLKSEVEVDVSLCNAVINMYGKTGDIGHALDVFYTFEAPNVDSWTLVMAGCLQWGCFEEAVTLFYNMLRGRNVVPDESTFIVMLKVSAELFSMRYGKLLHGLAEKTGFKSDKSVEDALIMMYCRNGDIKAAEKVFLGMTFRDTRTWNMMICGYCLHGFGNKSLALFEEMLKLGEDPNNDTFVGVLNACGELRLVEKGFYFFNKVMQEKGLEPGLKHYTAIVHILLKSRRLLEAFDFMVSAPITWDITSWRTLLRACRVHKNYRLHLQATTAIPEGVVDVPEWGAFAHMRDLIKMENDEVIEPGLSWVEVNKNVTIAVRSVVKGDPRFDKHHEMMRSLFASIKAYGNVVHGEVEDGIKEDCDGYHSEKLAVALALLNTCKAAPICIIMEEGKMCDDCHSFMKLISKANKRLIMVRDSQRFHHFQDGSCSCADYC